MSNIRLSKKVVKQKKSHPTRALVRRWGGMLLAVATADAGSLMLEPCDDLLRMVGSCSEDYVVAARV